MHLPWLLLRITLCAALLTAATQLLSPVGAVPEKLSDLAEAAFFELKPGVAPSEWKISHPSEVLEAAAFSGDYEAQGGWCVRSRQVFQLDDGATAKRYALFYPPSVQSGAVPPLPDHEDSGLVARSCTLGAIWIEIGIRDVHDPDREAFKARTTVARDELSRNWGQPNPVSKFPHLIGAGNSYNAPWDLSFWQSASSWTHDSKTVVIAYAPDPERVIAYLFLGNGLTDAPWARYIQRVYSNPGPDITSTITAATSLAHLDANLTQTMISDTKPDYSRHFDSILPALQQWISAAQKVPERARGAALLIADRVLSANPQFDRNFDAENREAVQSLGAKFVNCKDYPCYSGNWLDEAKALDPRGPVGELVGVTELLEVCRPEDFVVGSPHPASYVGWPARNIALGEELLREFPHDQWTAWVEFIVADIAERQLDWGYKTLGVDMVPDPNVAPDSPKARQFRALAISHYRAALKLESETARGRAAWEEAWRLLAGLPPSRQDLSPGPCGVE